MTIALELQQLKKTYPGGVQALRGIDLQVEAGDFYALLGPNGAGKSTTIGIISSLVNKTSGRVSVFGYDLEKDVVNAKRQLGLVPQEFNFNPFETVQQIVVNQAGYYGVERKEAYIRSEKYLKQLDLWGKRNERARMLSGGMKRRLMIARALMHEPKLLILDEPTAGVDIELRRSMWGFLKDLNDKGTTIILTTHYLEEADSLSDNVCIIKDGKEVTQGTPAELRSLLRQHNLQVKFSSSTESKANLGLFQMQFQGKKFFQHGNIIVINTYSAQSDLLEITSFLLKQNIPFVGIEITEPTLEDVFLRLTQNGQEDQE